MTSGGPSTASAGASGPRSASQPHPSEAVKEKKDLRSWWKSFRDGEKKTQDQASPQGIFGVPLQISIRYANVAISLFNDEGQSYIYGYVPIVVAKCGVFLKEKATDVEGIFRLAGSEKRIKELKVAFDSPDRYGKGLDWTGYTVHDAANILRRYFNQLPEPIIPLEFYQRFRDPLRNHQAQAVGHIDAQSPSQGDFSPEAAIRAYQALITELPPLNRQLLLYILDLLAVFASKSDLNKMTTPNLAAIFQPGILNHPQHDMAPQEYRLSQDVLIFLIENQDSFLIGMQGTEAPIETVRDVQSGTSTRPPTTPTTPSRSKTVIGRSGSNSSVAAESVRKWGSLRRNVSVSSKHSKRSENGQLPGTPSPATPPGGVHRSNTVPSWRGGSAPHSPRLPRDKHSDPATPNPPSSSSGPATLTTPAVVETVAHKSSIADRPGSIQSTPVATTAPAFPAPPEVTSASSSETTTPLAGAPLSDASSGVTRDFQTPKKDTIPLLAPTGNAEKPTDRSASHTPSAASARKGFLDILKQSPTSDGEGRKPNKLQKKRIPGSALSSAQSSAHSLHDEAQDMQKSPISPKFAPTMLAPVPSEDSSLDSGEQSAYATAHNTPTGLQTTPQRNPTDATLRPTISPSNSFHSHTDMSHTDMSDADMVGDDMPAPSEDQAEKKKRHRWRFSRSQNKIEEPSTPANPLGTMTAREQATSRSTIGSGGSLPRKSLQEPRPMGAITTDPVPGAPAQQIQPSYTSDTVFSDSERERKGPMSWLRNRLDRKEKDPEKRSGTPERGHERTKSRQDVQSAEAITVRGKSLEQQRAPVEGAPAPTVPMSMGQEGPLAGQHTGRPNTNDDRNLEAS
ncbi:hypothetical protein DOTSEDRAFT_68516 [Dothistroma septosporum NZE10]|uniref:Rho-GAP domain-containing protein n=1 Tax=Dothistroma septosporum (strain NZE10 / CBS 128990) TaxID=675120 RepID=N1Q4V8_DOTSN|nr:hypothetical protein DOTSEDRAFT_68516 [Dothistroma septosporum NZE10]